MYRIDYSLKGLLCALLCCWMPSLWGQATANLEGTVVDSLQGSPLAFATYQLEGTARAGVTDAEGAFHFYNLEAGDYVLLVRYLGYEPRRIPLSLKVGEERELKVTLAEIGFTTEAVEISFQLEGQRAAIQQQINSNTIVNVVSRDKIQELPDQNAAEAVGRISGVSVQRDGGEATKVVVRGLAPKYTSVTVNGERLPATDGNDRSVDLSMVSIDAVGGIEVYKALTPDQDGDAVGGSVNFVVKQAPKGLRGDLRLQTGYNRLAREFWQNRGAVNVSNRFLDDKLGLILTGNYQRANRSFHELQADFENRGTNPDGTVDIILSDINLASNLEQRERYGGSLTLDYDLPKGYIMISSLLGVLDRDETRYRRRFRPNSSRQEYEVRDGLRQTLTLSNSLTFEYAFGRWHMRARASYSTTNNNTPYEHTSRFREDGAFGGNVDEQFIDSVVLAARNNLQRTVFQQDRLDQTEVFQRNLTGQFDLERPFQVGEWLTGLVKTGLKWRDQYRTRDSRRDWTAFGALGEVVGALPDRFAVNRDSGILAAPFFGSYQPVDFLQGDWPYAFGQTLDTAQLNGFAREFAPDFYSEDERLRLQNYRAEENIRSAYLMMQGVFFERLTLLPGVRLEQTRTRYEGLFGRSFEQDGRTQVTAVDTVGGQDYLSVLPMVHLKYQFTPWFDLRLALTRSLSRPDFYDLVPWQEINDIDRRLQRGNPDLAHTKVWNYDVFLSFYNKWGLFTIGGFHKELADVSVQRFSRVQDGGPSQGYQLIEPINLSEENSTVSGIEFDLQGNLRNLPAPWDGIVLGANFTWLRSQSFFPFTQVEYDAFFQPIFRDTLRPGPLPDQPDYIFNLSVGYEKKGFSGRLAFFVQGSSLQAIGATAREDFYNQGFNRLDLTLKQQVYKGLSVFVNANNLTNQREQAVIQGRFAQFGNTRDAWTKNRIYGWTMDLGVKWKF